MKCPKCDSKFETVSFAEIEVERCLGCFGLWFDLLEKDDLLKIEGSETIDIGTTQIGEQYNNLRNVKCPKCSVEMMIMVDKDQYHIKYEHCPSCYGTFLDAGEFRELTELNIVERFREMIKTLRTNL